VLTTVEGVYQNGRVELKEVARVGSGQRVLVTFLDDESANGKEKPAQGRLIQYGMYAGPIETSEEDFKLAEFHGDPDDGLKWSGL